MAERLSTRVDRVERLVEVLAEKQKRLDDVLVLLTEAQIRTEERFQETDQRFQETEKKFQRTDERIVQIAAEDAARGRVLDERIDKLVSAIGELIRVRNGGAKP